MSQWGLYDFGVLLQNGILIMRTSLLGTYFEALVELYATYESHQPPAHNSLGCVIKLSAFLIVVI